MALLRPLFPAVNLVRVLQAGFRDPGCLGGIHRAEKARLVTFVTSGADLFDLDQKRVSIAIERDVLDRLDMTARFALHPELFPRSAPKVGFSSFNRLLD